MKSNSYFFDRFMGSITLVNGVILSVVLWYFSFNFISKIFTGSILIAAILALAVEITKIITNYYASSFSIKGIESISGRVLNNFLRIFAVVLSSVFCLSEVSHMSNKPNIEKALTSEVAQVQDQLKSRREVLVESYSRRKEAIYEQIKILSDLRYPTQAQQQRLSELDQQLISVNEEEEEMLRQSNMELVSRQGTIQKQLVNDPSANNQKINDILFAMGVAPGPQYTSYYRYFTLISSILLTVFLEFASITTIRNFTKYLYDTKRYKL
ncbi:hypothetical protein EDD80_103175 [Anseongella ginsenosidimutans]|uniref:DUF4407 domain-containing protein n=1 Tax=Anseongella ginsenosidimutans TaxID=496056 RepID=A0A4V2UTY9_9SPHI|nr:hypothetical protein [Anseongella ginsenosidimutans]QEC53423.1 hypothetical protein FRZ59_14475 [Anseongella ginsenosidimutans]TCS88312.1 hypothetical protein EDD80_103175 [Anseongella ginsenosidimutans]